MKEEDKIKELEKRIEELEKRPVYIPVCVHQPNQAPNYTEPHYHGTLPCYNNPCNWWKLTPNTNMKIGTFKGKEIDENMTKEELFEVIECLIADLEYYKSRKITPEEEVARMTNQTK